jgi:hypothetical protein
VEASHGPETPNIRVVVSVDDLGLESFVAVWESFVLAADGMIVAR